MMVKSDRHNSIKNGVRVLIFVVFNSFEPLNSTGDSSKTQLTVVEFSKELYFGIFHGWERQCNMILWQDSFAKRDIQKRVFLIESFSTVFSLVLYTFIL